MDLKLTILRVFWPQDFILFSRYHIIYNLSSELTQDPKIFVSKIVKLKKHGTL